jgi:hypothetical protein
MLVQHTGSVDTFFHIGTILMKRTVLNFCAGMFLTFAATAGESPVVEHSKPLPWLGSLGTMAYKPTELERPFLSKLPDGEQATARLGEHAYTLSDKVGKSVGWFGIVRSVSEDREKKVTHVKAEMKHFDGMTDLHLQVVSITGAGDFAAVIPGVDHDIQLLSLVRVYGKVAGESDHLPQVDAEYVRVWRWGLFTFMEYGDDKSNPEWKKLRQRSGTKVYSSRPDKEYYESLLGKRAE